MHELVLPSIVVALAGLITLPLTTPRFIAILALGLLGMYASLEINISPTEPGRDHIEITTLSGYATLLEADHCHNTLVRHE